MRTAFIASFRSFSLSNAPPIRGWCTIPGDASSIREGRKVNRVQARLPHHMEPQILIHRQSTRPG